METGSPILVSRRHATDQVYVTGTRQVMIGVHDPSECEDWPCCIHGPSRHPLVNAPTHWRIKEVIGDEDIILNQVMERICPCGNFHPDPDDLRFIAISRGEVEATRLAQHDCCGCCQ